MTVPSRHRVSAGRDRQVTPRAGRCRLAFGPFPRQRVAADSLVRVSRPTDTMHANPVGDKPPGVRICARPERVPVSPQTTARDQERAREVSEKVVEWTQELVKIIEAGGGAARPSRLMPGALRRQLFFFGSGCRAA